jgi:hypothetical protein
MTIRDFFLDYSRSALGMASHFLALGAGLALGLPSAYFKGGPIPGALAFIAALVILDGLCLITGLGPRSAAAEAARKASGRARRRLDAARTGLDSLAVLRLAPGPVAQARDHLVFEARRFLDEAGKASGDPGSDGPAYDPGALAAMEEALGLVDAWQREADETSLERRFGAPDAHPIADADARIAQALEEKTALIAKGRENVSGELPAANRLSIEEELK